MPAKTAAANEDTENRRRRLRKWIADNYDGKQAKFVAAKLLNQGEISALLGTKSFGSVKARTLELQAGMPTRYLDQRDEDTATPAPLPATLTTAWPFPLVARDRYEALSPEMRGYVQKSMNDALDYCEKTIGRTAEGQTPVQEADEAADTQVVRIPEKRSRVPRQVSSPYSAAPHSPARKSLKGGK